MSEDSTIRRRAFLAGATATAAGAALNSETLASDANALGNLKHADFTQLIGQPFAVDGASEQGTRQRGTLILKEVVVHDTARTGDRPSHVRSEPFSLRFESRDVTLAIGTHRIAGGALAGQGVYLHEMLDQRVPGQRQYEAVFN